MTSQSFTFPIMPESPVATPSEPDELEETEDSREQQPAYEPTIIDATGLPGAAESPSDRPAEETPSPEGAVQTDVAG